MLYGVMNAIANRPTKEQKRLTRRARATTCFGCGAEIPPGRPGRECKDCREGGNQPDMNTLMDQMDQG